MSLTLKHGDTMVEVLFGISVFGLVSVISIAAMNAGVYTSEATLELAMARNEIDAQSEALRFIHNAYLSEREFATGNQTYRAMWTELKQHTNGPDDGAILPLSVGSCSERYNGVEPGSIFNHEVIIVNTRKIDPDHPTSTIYSKTLNESKFTTSSLYPRLIFGKSGSSTATDNSDSDLRETYDELVAAEGIWVIPVKSKSANNSQPEFYDFHVYTCWNAPGRSIPTTIGTIIRLYNPELIEADQGNP